MNSPKPIEELPSFIKENYNIATPVNNLWLKYIIAGGVIVLAIAISVTLVSNSQRNINLIKKEEHGD
jgi:hypothetical protein|tara:strand:+ start:160 stop:360 length:201 start_codon:yes stop_codon:yes gene_type:complete